MTYIQMSLPWPISRCHYHDLYPDVITMTYIQMWFYHDLDPNVIAMTFNPDVITMTLIQM